MVREHDKQDRCAAKHKGERKRATSLAEIQVDELRTDESESVVRYQRYIQTMAGDSLISIKQ